jgi:dienelactone hydrolase
MRLNQAQSAEDHAASVGFCFAKIAWQFAPHTRDGGCFLEGIL